MNLLSPGIVAGALVMCGGLANAAGYPLAGAFLSDPATATSVTMVATGLGALIAGAMVGLKRKPTA